MKKKQRGSNQLAPILFLILLCIVPALIFHTAMAKQLAPTHDNSLKYNNILILHSYSLDYIWTQNQHAGITSALAPLDWTNTIRVEFLDTKNIYTPHYSKALVTFFKEKYKDTEFDIVIGTDNNALDFITDNGADLFPDASFIATGINGTETMDLPQNGTTIIAEKARHLETLKVALTLRQKAKNCYIFSGSTITGETLKGEVKEVIEHLDTDVMFHFISKESVEDMLYFTTTIAPDDFIYLLPYFKDGLGKSYAQRQVATAIAKVSPVPVFCSWDFQMYSGTLGGATLSGVTLGEIAGKVAIDTLQNKTTPTLINDASATMDYVFDYNMVKKFNIKSSDLPKNSTFINKPTPFLQKHKKVVFPSVVVITFLIITTLLLFKNLAKQKLLNSSDKKIIDLNAEIIETQRELVATLGEVIENRSKETGNHVKRVALYSRFIAQKVGLSSKDIEIIEAASPLHDVGKIGIPEKILNSPERLNSEDFSKMQEHTQIGRDILSKSNKELLKSACSIAYQHHERWDGSGYPQGLRGEEIDIFARITMLADIYDALSMNRCYKSAWPEEKVVKYILREKGRHFDPILVDIFMENYEEIKQIRLRHPSDDLGFPMFREQDLQSQPYREE